MRKDPLHTAGSTPTAPPWRHPELPPIRRPKVDPRPKPDVPAIPEEPPGFPVPDEPARPVTPPGPAPDEPSSPDAAGERNAALPGTHGGGSARRPSPTSGVNPTTAV